MPETLTRNLTSRRWATRSDTLDEKTRSVEAVLSTETQATVFDWQRWDIIDEVLDMSGCRFDAEMPLCREHNSHSLDGVIGRVENLRLEGKQLVGRLVFLEGDEQADEIWNKVRQRAVRAVSIGYEPMEGAFKDIAPGESDTVNGKTYTAGKRTLRITTAWTVRETSVVVIGADEYAKMRAAHGGAPNDGGNPMGKKKGGTGIAPVKREDPVLEEEREDEEPLEEQEGETPEEEREGEEPLEEQEGETPEEEREGEEPEEARGKKSGQTPRARRAAAEALLAERARVKRIHDLAGDDIPQSLVTKAVTEGWSVSRTKGAFLKAIRDGRAPAAGLNVVAPRDMNQRETEYAIAGSIALRVGGTIVNPRDNAAEQQRQLRGMEQAGRLGLFNLIDVCREACRVSGLSVPGDRFELMRRAFSTMAMTNIFTTNINAVLQKEYMEAPDSTQGWVLDTDVANYLTQERQATSPLTHLTRHPEGGEIKHKVMADSKETFKIARYSGKIEIDEIAIVNDNLDAFKRVPTNLANAARRTPIDLIYSILLANPTLSATSTALFDASTHANLTTAVLGATGVQAAIAAMAKQTYTVNGQVVHLNIQAAHLVVPQDLVFAAEILLASAERIISTSDGGTYNPLKNRNITLHADNRIGAAGVVDPTDGTARTGSATNWFLFGNANEYPIIERAWLEGTGRGPQLRTVVLDRDRYGIAWEVQLNVGAKALDYRAAHKSTGAG